METRANFILIGSFTLAVVALAFGFIYWLARIDEAVGQQPLEIVFDGAVTGLGQGGSVLFNGIKVGEVASLEVDSENPNRVRVLTYVEENTPLRSDTTARLEYQGLTGVAVIQLVGGSPTAEPLSVSAEGKPPVIVAGKSQLQNLMDAATNIAEKGSKLFARLDKVLETNEDAIDRSLANVEKFTDTLAANSERFDNFMRDASAFVARLEGMSDGLDQLIKGINSLTGENGGELMQNIGATFKRIDTFLAENEAPLKETIKNIDTFSATLADNSDEFDKFMKDAGELATRLNAVSGKLDTVVDQANKLLGEDGHALVQDARSTLKRIDTFIDQDGSGMVKDARSTFQRVDKFLAENEAPLKETIKNVETFSGTLAKNTEGVDKFIKDVGQLADRLNGLSTKLDSVLTRADSLLGEEGSGMVKEARSAFSRLDTFLAENSDSFANTIKSAEKFTAVLSENSDGVASLITDANVLAKKLNKVGDDIDKLVARVSEMVDTDGAGFLKDAREAAATFRQLSTDLSERLDKASEGITRATGRGVRELESFLTEGRTTFRSIRALVDRMERNPQRFLSGRSQVPEYSPR